MYMIIHEDILFEKKLICGLFLQRLNQVTK